MRRTLALLSALTMVLGLLPGSAAPAEAAPGGWLARINAFRAENGLGPLIEDTTVTIVAQVWTQTMAGTNTLAHNPLLAQQILPFTRYGENVGVNVDEATVFEQFTNSPRHRANLLGPYNVVGIGQVVSGGRVWTTHDFAFNPTLPVLPLATAASSPPPPPATVAAAGRSTGGMWTASAAGQVAARAGAPHFGQLAVAPNRPVVGTAGTPSGSGYWLVASDGGIFAYGDAAFFGSTGSIRLNQPIVGMAASPTGRGYWLVASDGGIFAYGDAGFFGSTGSFTLVSPVVGITRSLSGRGYRMVAADGGIFSFGDAPFSGSLGGRPLPGGSPVVAMAGTPSGQGYWLVQASGAPHSFGDAPQA